LLKLVLHIQEKLSISFLFKHDIYKVIAHFPTTINLLFRNFSKQAGIVVACKTSTKIIPDFLQLLICEAISQNYDANLCENDAITLVSVVFHDATLTPQELHKAYFPFTCL